MKILAVESLEGYYLHANAVHIREDSDPFLLILHISLTLVFAYCRYTPIVKKSNCNTY
jgi:hypothetical protein